MIPTLLPFQIGNDTSTVRLEALNESHSELLWTNIQSDRIHHQRKGGWPTVSSLEDTRVYIQACNQITSGEFFYGIFDVKNNLVGSFHVHSIDWDLNQAEIGYWVHHAYQGNGVIHSAIKLIEQSLSSIGFKALYITSPVWNLRSRAVAKKAEYSFLSLSHEDLQCDGCDDCVETYRKDI